MKKYIYIILLIILISSISVLAQKNKQTEITKIGLVGPFSGNLAVFGEFMQRGLFLAQSNLNSKEINNFEIIQEDDACVGKNSISAVEKLIFLDKVNYIIGPMCNEASLATEKLFEDNKVISITIGLPSNIISNMGPYHFSFSPEIEYLMKQTAEEVISRGFYRIGIIHMKAAFEDENYTHFVKYFTAGGGQIVADEAEIKGTNDFRNSILKIKVARPQALMVIAHSAELNSVLKQLAEQNFIDIPKFGIHSVESPMILQVKDFAENLIYPYPGDNEQNSSAKEYAEMYQKKYGAAADPYSINVFDGVNILLSAIKKCGNDKYCVQQYLSNLKDYQGASGSLSVDSRGVGNYKEIMLKTIRDGKFVKLER